MRALLALAAWLGASALAGAQTAMPFADGAGQVTIPAHYEKVEDKDASLVVVSRPEGNVRLYFDLHKLDAARIANAGEALIHQQAKEKKKTVRKRGNKVTFFDPSPPARKDGRTMLYLHWQVGFDRTLVVMSAHVWEDAKDAPDVQRFLSGDIEQIIDSLRRVGGGG